MKKTTLATLYSMANRGNLIGKIKMEFDGRTDGIESRKIQKYEKFTSEKMKRYLATKNYITEESDKIKFHNCCYSIEFLTEPQAIEWREKNTYECGEEKQDIEEFLKKYYYEQGIDSDQLVDRLGNPNLFEQEDLAYFIIQLCDKGVIGNYIKS